MYSEICVKLKEIPGRYFILVHDGPTLRISTQKNYSNYVKKFLHPRICLKMLISHDFEYAENGWSIKSIISKYIGQNISKTSDIKFIITYNEEK